ncbi:MAG: hypothetical protein COT81_04230 [Candidatus Buchananbacteria bacterium CG10_big_fil_rev_8_21_14_0_10_42_9]|uniref:DAGKc domain-containing protein n=1 Tax=Candidatus Buchananbacteria bacterium CG10_big_fil_rev_8_21_14_0_10_42_9 TaxID=1974526 RepID=A0A2H0W0J5_9BACT|nr:MAG: hypothetical protein COT81_04230 [Candidatus Buchananbacteria bacterium CG10_big_fil_rev_8_21_14_0_10_42_9]
MYLYLYDSLLSEKKYQRQLIKMEMQLTDLGIGGKISRLSPLKNLKQLIEEEVRVGVKTVVAVGNDKTLFQVINAIVGRPVVLGIVPFGPNNTIAHDLGINSVEDATKTISTRIIQKIDLGKINNDYFVSQATISDGQAVIEFDDKFAVSTEHAGSKINVCNLRPAHVAAGQNHFNPQDGYLDLLVETASRKGMFRTEFAKSIFPFKRIFIRGPKTASITADGGKIFKTPVKIEAAPQKIKMIVSKKRDF